MKTGLKIVIFLVCLLASVSVASAGTIERGYTTTAGVDADLLSGFNAVTCEQLYAKEQLGCTGNTLYIPTTPWSGVYDVGNYKLTLTERNNVVQWTSTAKINCIFLKSGNGGDAYNYSGYCYPSTGNPISADSRLSTPLECNNANPKVCTPKDISHIVVCYDNTYVPPPPTPTPEFPSLALPAGMMIGILGLVFLVKSREN